MAFWRKLGLVGLGLSLLDGAATLADPDGPAATGAEIAMVASLLAGGRAEPKKGGTGEPVDLNAALSELGRSSLR